MVKLDHILSIGSLLTNKSMHNYFPMSALLTKNGKIISRGYNKIYSCDTDFCSIHAEVDCVNNFLRDYRSDPLKGIKTSQEKYPLCYTDKEQFNVW